MNNGNKELPTATELAMIAAQLRDSNAGKMESMFAAHSALSLWKACRWELEIESCVVSEDARLERQPVPFDAALVEIGFTEQTALKREHSLLALLSNEGVFDAIRWPNTSAEEAVTLLKKSGIFRDQMAGIKLIRERSIRTKKQAAAKARHKSKRIRR